MSCKISPGLHSGVESLSVGYSDYLLIERQATVFKSLKLALGVEFCHLAARGDTDHNKLNQLMACPWLAIGSRPSGRTRHK